MFHPHSDLIALLLARGIVTPAQVEECHADCAAPGGPPDLLHALQARGYVDRSELEALGSLVGTGGKRTVLAAASEEKTVRVAPATAAPVLRTLGRFEILEECGRGGMGVVFRARDPQLGRIVALKGLRVDRSLDDPEAARLLREARAAARLRHPGIVQVHEVGEAEGRAYRVMEFIDGRTLMDHLRRLGPGIPVDLRAGAELVRQVAEAVAYAHQERIIHRDLKPENILVDTAGRACVGDFGLAREIGTEAMRLTATGALLGTPAYMSPEQAEGRPAGPQSDVWGVGAVLYEVLAGRPPFGGESLPEILHRVVLAEPARPSRLDPRVPRDLETICLRCLEKDPARRYPSAQAIAEDLGRWLRGEAITARPASLLQRVGRWVARRKALAAACAALALALGAAAILGLQAWRTAREHRRSVIESEFYREMEVRVVEAVERRRLGRLEPLHLLLREGTAEADRRLAQDPDSAAAWFVKGWILRLGGRLAAAEPALTEAVARRPDDPTIRYQRGLARAQRYREAAEAARRGYRGSAIAGGYVADQRLGEFELAAIDAGLANLREAAEEDLAALDAASAT